MDIFACCRTKQLVQSLILSFETSCCRLLESQVILNGGNLICETCDQLLVSSLSSPLKLLIHHSLLYFLLVLQLLNVVLIFPDHFFFPFELVQ